MDDIAREAGITKKTLYQYIRNKDDLVMKVLELLEKNHKSFFREIESKNINAIESLMVVNKLLLKMFKDHNPSFEFDLQKYHPEIYHWAKERGRKKLCQAIKDNLKKGIKEGLYRKDLDDEIIAKLHVSMIDTINEKHTFTREEMLSSEFILQLMEYHIKGVASEKGYRLFDKYRKMFNDQTIE